MSSDYSEKAKGLAAAAVLAGASLLGFLAAVHGAEPREAPEFPTQDRSHWVGDPVRLKDLRGKVVLLDVWTFG